MRAKENVLDFGLGLIAHLIERGKELCEKGRWVRGEIRERLRKHIEMGREIRERMQKTLGEEKEKVLRRLGIVSRGDIEGIKERLKEIERKLGE